MKTFIAILFLVCFTTGFTLAKSSYEPNIEISDPILKNETKASYIVSTTTQAIFISSITRGSHIWVFDASGRNVYNKVAKDNAVTVPIRSKGVFIIRIKTDKEIFTTKVLVK